MRHLLLSTLLFSSFISFSQTKWMVVNNKSGTSDSIRVSDVESIVFRTHEETPANTITDIDGNIYHTVIIGTQEWTVENLRVTHYNDGSPITKITTNNTTWSSTTNGAYCAYENNETNGAFYGYLYNWYSVNTGKLAPLTGGWRVPTEVDWTALTDFIGGEATAGTKLKATSGWNSKGNGTDDYGFSALPGGFRVSTGDFYYLGGSGNWWSLTAYNASIAWFRNMVYDFANVYRGNSNKMYGRSVRLVRDL